MSTATTSQSVYPNLFNPVLVAGCIIILVSFAVRSSFGLFQIPVADEFGWLRSEFSLAIAIQNLFWGIGQPLFSALAEKFGDRKAIVAGAACYVAGLLLSSLAVTPGQIQMLEVFVGFGIAGMGFGVILAVVGRSTAEKHRSLALGIATAAGSAGQIVGPPVAQTLLNHMPWQEVFIWFSGFIVLSLMALTMMRAPQPAPATKQENMGTVVKAALKDPSFMLIFIGFFSCGYQLAFITAHFPALVAEMCTAVDQGSLFQSLGISSTSTLGAVAIALIGFANIGGTVAAGWLGNKYSRKYLLAMIYAARTVVAVLFIMNPITPTSVVLFSISMGSLWLATVPLTSGLVAKIYGLRYMGTLYGIVFFSHQLGGFLGVWLGGAMYDIYGNYQLVWWVGVGFGLISAIVHLPIIETPLAERSDFQAA